MTTVYGDDISEGTVVYWDPTFGFPLLSADDVPIPQRGVVQAVREETNEVLVQTITDLVWVFADDIIGVVDDWRTRP